MGSLLSREERAVPPDGATRLLPYPFPGRHTNDPKVWGFIDTKGVLRIPPTYDADADQFYEGFARVASHLARPEVHMRGGAVVEHYDTRRYGFINPWGKLVVPMKYLDAGNVSEGLSRVRDAKSKLWGFVDATGKLVIPFSYVEAGDFCVGRAMVRSEEHGKIGFIDAKGELMIPLTLDGPNVTSFTKDGLAWGRVRDGSFKERDGYLDRDGNWAIPPTFALCQPFSEGLAHVRRELNLPWVFIDTHGREVFSTNSDDCHAFSEGCAAIHTISSRGPDSEWRYVDKSGRPIPGLEKLMYLRCGVFRSGVAWVCDHQMRWGLIDRTGRVMLRPGEVVGVGRFEDGIAPIEDFETGMTGYIDNSGRVIREPAYV